MLRQQERVAWQSEHERPREDRDNTAPRPSSSRPYEDRGYPTSPSAVRRPVPPRLPPTRHINDAKGAYADREYGPHKSSINQDNRRREGWERPDREALWGDDHGHQASGRERAWERDRDPYPNAGGHPSQYIYGALQRYGSYPTPPESPNRHGGRDYFPMSALYDSREPAPPSRVYSYGNYAPPPQSTPSEDYEKYHRQESMHDMPPTRQMLYWGRESGDRRLEDLSKFSSSSPI
jgi:hypothetical protein